MPTLEFPSILASSEEWSLEYNTQTFVSDLNGAVQTAELPGARWSLRMTFSNRTGRDARRLQGFLSGLRGRAGRFWAVPAGWQPVGTPDGAGIVGLISSGVTSHTGSELPTRGWTANTQLLFAAGDFFEVNGELKQITEDVSADEQGQATLKFAPPLRNAVPRDAAIRWERPRCLMMLNSDVNGWQVSAPVIYALTIECREALDV